VAALVIGGVAQGLKLNNPNIAFAEVTKTVLPFLRASTLGLIFLLLANLLFALNLFVMLIVWHISVVKAVIAAVIAPLKKVEVKA
jgi:hypothetical protein